MRPLSRWIPLTLDVPMRPLLILKTGQTLPSLRTQGEDFEDWIRHGLDGAATLTVDVTAGQPLPELSSCSGIVVTGSPAMVTDQAEWSERSADYLRAALACSLPVLGICYGHQLLAHALGGVVGYHPQGREIGTVDIRLNAAHGGDALFAGLPARFPAHATHSQSVLQLPPGAVLLASSEHDAHHAFRVGELAWGVQFHPEFDARIMRTYIQERQQDLRREGLDVEALLGQVRPTPEATRLLRDFARLARQGV